MTSDKRAKTTSKDLPLEARAVKYIADFAAPKTTQDSVDQMCAEFATAYVLRTQSERRYDAIKSEVMDVYENDIASLRDDATKGMSKVVNTITGEDWHLVLAVNKPAIRHDINVVRTELIRRGVNVDIIDEAIEEAGKKTTPALIITATPSR